MKVTVAAFGKLKTPGVRATADYYAKLISPWASFEEIELKPLPVPAKEASLRLQIQEKEGHLLLDRLKIKPGRRQLLILLDETGKSKTTEEWAKTLKLWEDTSISEVVFCIGSSLGFSKEVREQAQFSFSLGPQTLSHELARVILLEQIYRALSVLRGHPYHNAGS